MMNLEGNIGEINLIERLVEMWHEQFTGAIRFENDGIIKILYFKGGDILSASTNDRGDSIDEILMKAGKVSRDHVKQALAKRKENETLGDALLNLGFITRKELAWARRVQVVGVIRSIAAWEAGTFTIVADYLPKRDEGTLFPLPQIIVELIVTEPDRVRFESSMRGGDLILEPSEMFDSVFPTLGLNEDADAIAGAINGNRSAREVANVSGRDTFNVYKLLHALSLLGVLRESTGPKAIPEVSLDQFDFGMSAEPEAEPGWAGLSNDNSPAFDLDDAPSLELPSLGDMNDALPAAVATASPIVWDDPPAWEPTEERLPELESAPSPAPKSVAWDTAPEPVAVPIQVPIEPPAKPVEEQWGFDEAQLETSRRAIPPPMATGQAEGRKRGGLLVPLLVLLVIAGAAYGGWVWWSGREASDVAVAEPVRRAEKSATTTSAPAPAATAAPVETGTIVPLSTITETVAPNTTTAGTATASTTTATTSAVPPAQAPPVTTAPAPAAPVAVSADRARIDAMAREFAANPAGRYTVQIQILCDPSNVAQAMTRGGGQLWFLSQTLGTRACYRVFWGRFDGEAEARAAMRSIPAALRDPNAAVKTIPRG